MLYQFLLNFVDTFGFLNVFKYLTFRTGLSFFTSLLIVLVIGGSFIKFFSNQRILNPMETTMRGNIQPGAYNATGFSNGMVNNANQIFNTSEERNKII